MLCRQGPFPGTPGNGPCLNQDLTMFVISGSCLAVGSEHLGDLVRNDVFDILAAVTDVLSGIEVVRMSHEVLADTGCHAEAEIRVDIDLADRACSCFAKLTRLQLLCEADPRVRRWHPSERRRGH